MVVTPTLKFWHLQKSEYGFKELKEWLRNEGTLDKSAKGRFEKSEKDKRKRGKGKGKEKGKETQVDEGGKGKGKEKGVEGDDSGKGKAKASTRIHKRK